MWYVWEEGVNFDAKLRANFEREMRKVIKNDPSVVYITMKGAKVRAICEREIMRIFTENLAMIVRVSVKSWRFF